MTQSIDERLAHLGTLPKGWNDLEPESRGPSWQGRRGVSATLKAWVAEFQPWALRIYPSGNREIDVAMDLGDKEVYVEFDRRGRVRSAFCVSFNGDQRSACHYKGDASGFRAWLWGLLRPQTKEDR